MPSQPTFLAYDIESSGLDADKHEILSIAMMLLDINLEEVDRKLIYALPKRIEDADAKALEINGYDFGIWTERGAVTQEEMFEEIKYFLRNRSWLRQIAHNHRFDERFLKALYARYGQDLPRLYNDTFSFHALDTIALAIFTDVALQGRMRKGYGLAAMAETYSIENRAAHSAMEDVECMVECLRAMVRTVREAANIKPKPIEPAMNGILKCLDKDKDIWIFARGKHAGKMSYQVLDEDRQYLAFVLGFPDLAPLQRSHLLALVEKK